MNNNDIVIKRGLRLGDLEAETDKDLLLQCFVDVGDIERLTDVEKPESIIVGRTGSGKSALLLKINQLVEKSVILDPNHISIRFLEHSDVIQFFEELDVNLDLFYRYLWRHILTIEFLKLRYSLKNIEDCDTLWHRLTSFVDRDGTKREALAYFREWGEKFWLETDEQLKEVTEHLTRELKAALGANLQGVDITLAGAKALSQEKRVEIVARAKRVVNSIQIKKLTEVLDLLEDKVFDDKQKRFYVLIDKLDEEWAESITRYRFIRALIEEIKTFRRVSNTKIIIAMRRDLLDIVFDRTRDSGFQQEKYESYFLPLIWAKEDLATMVELRINEVFKRQYTKDGVKFSDIFPSSKKHENQTALDFILERTLYRPRDVMQFVNECLVQAFSAPRVSWRAISAAEANYSDKRLKSLFEEWSDVYPGVEESIEVLRNIPEVFTRSVLSDRIDKMASKVMDYQSDPCGRMLMDYCEGRGSYTESDITAEFINCFFRIGAIAVKVGTKDPYMWSDYDNAILSRGAIKRVNRIKVHKMMHRTLGITTTGEAGQK